MRGAFLADGFALLLSPLLNSQVLLLHATKKDDNQRLA